MPELSRFHGIVITMYAEEHGVPHFHARHGEANAAISIDRLTLLAGSLPRRQMALVIKWAQLHQPELREAWHSIQQDSLPERIAPLP